MDLNPSMRNQFNNFELSPLNPLSYDFITLSDSPQEIKVIMDQAENGVIFFCFGTLLQASSFRKEAVNTFLSVFKELKQTVLWKSNLNASDWDIPKNVHMRNWFDQPSILGGFDFLPSSKSMFKNLDVETIYFRNPALTI